MTQRTERVGDLIRAELADLLLREVRDPRVGLATVSSVEVARDFSHATVKVSVLGTEAERAAAIAALERAKGFLRRELSRRISLRTTPELHFSLDRGAEHSQRISELLERAQTGDVPAGAAPGDVPPSDSPTGDHDS
jgi:ribosome-binding factor A